jgi:Tol biopolymer transport system component
VFLDEGDPNGDPPAWLPDGSLIVSVKQNPNVVWYRVPAVGGRPVRLGTAPWGSASYRWSADGQRILATVRNDMADVYAIRNFGELLGH